MVVKWWRKQWKFERGGIGGTGCVYKPSESQMHKLHNEKFQLCPCRQSSHRHGPVEAILPAAYRRKTQEDRYGSSERGSTSRTTTQTTTNHNTTRNGGPPTRSNSKNLLQETRRPAKSNNVFLGNQQILWIRKKKQYETSDHVNNWNENSNRHEPNVTVHLLLRPVLVHNCPSWTTTFIRGSPWIPCVFLATTTPDPWPRWRHRPST